ncbi:MAG: RNA polymerase sporulation sigma factor SigG [Christensenellales bacterium]
MLINKVEICGVDTSKLPVMKQKQMSEMMLKIKAGDKAAREEFIKGNLRLVLSVIQRFSGRKENMDDLFQVGCIGLIKAIDNFNVELGVRFSTYAVPMITGELRRYLRDNNSIRVSRSLRDIAYKALQIRNMLSKKDSADPSIEKIANEMGVNVEDVVFALDAIQDPVSLYEPVYHDGSDAIFVMDLLADNSGADTTWFEGLALKEAMEKLSEREKNIINMRFYQGKTQMEVANEIGISQAQVSRLEKNALKAMRRTI